jgi:hypothetical protein
MTKFIKMKDYSYSKKQIIDDLSILENRLTCKIPEDYKLFLELTNGGVIWGNAFMIEISNGYCEEDQYLNPDHFFGIYKKDDYYTEANEKIPINLNDHLVMSYLNFEVQQLRDASQDIKLLPIARDQGGSLFALLLNSYNPPEIIFIYKDINISQSLSIDGYKLSNSFTSFLKLLIDQNGGYIENLSEIYQELVKKGFK